MITAAKLAIYRSYGGNVDLWHRAGSPKSDMISGEDWAAISTALQDLAFANVIESTFVGDWRKWQLIRKLSASFLRWRDAAV